MSARADSVTAMTRPVLTSVGAFAGIGGIERGFERSGIHATTLIEVWEPARAVLARHFPDAALEGDIATVKSVPKADILTGGFPCTDLSQAGRTDGIHGEASGLVDHMFRLLPQVDPTWLVLENVRNMLVLDRGQAMRYLVNRLELSGYRWAYRLVDSRAFGVAQRRQRVLLVASRTEDPRRVLFADEAGQPDDDDFSDQAYGFYWTEGIRGLGWARDAVPTLKGGSTIGIPSPPAVWVREAGAGRAFITPSIEDSEALQGFPRGWTAPAAELGTRGARDRWKLVGNAVTVGAAEWLGRRLVKPGRSLATDTREIGSKWPTSGWGGDGAAYDAEMSLWPVRAGYTPLLKTITLRDAKPLSHRGASGFLSRLDRGSLRVSDEFRDAMRQHIDAVA